eukprot:jgi/Botrbrau1/7828/Bobra.9_2s0009.1
MEVVDPVLASPRLRLQIRHIRDLPLDVLIKILASLDLFTLRMTRLVCKAFREASIPRITVLWCNSLRFDTTPEWLAHGLVVFSSIRELHLGLALPRDASMVVLPTVVSTLRSLTVTFLGKKEAVSCSWEALVPRLAGATQLTALTIDRMDVQGAGFKLADGLRAFTALEKLDLHAIPNGEGENLAEAVLELSRLRRLGCMCWVEDGDCFKETVIHNASRMTRLQSLEWRAQSKIAGLEQIATLTQLTSLLLHTRRYAWGISSDLLQLSCLTAMQVLRLERMELSMDELRQLVSPMTKLRELVFCSEDGDAARLDPLLARLPMISALHIRGDLRDLQLPASRLPNGFASLRSVSLQLIGFQPTGVVKLAEAFTGLESLKLGCDGDVAHAFLNHLPCFRNLTELELDLQYEQLDVPYPEMPQCMGCTSLRFLADLRNLKRLAFDLMVDAWVWGDGKKLAALTGLTELCIKQEGHVLPLTSEQVRPLTRLTRLERLLSCLPWGAAFDSSDFRRALHGRQHELGLPPTNITLLRW